MQPVAWTHHRPTSSSWDEDLLVLLWKSLSKKLSFLHLRKYCIVLLYLW